MTNDHPDNDKQLEDGPTLAQVISLFHDLLAETELVELALYDCPEPLNLKSSLRTLAEAANLLRYASQELEMVDEIIEQRLSISSSFGTDRITGGKQEVASGEFLSPKQINTLFKIGQVRPDYSQFILADHLCQVTGTPPAALIKAEKLARKQRQLDLKALEATSKTLLEDVESRTCATCSAAPNQYCRTTSGKIAEKPHRPRVKLSVVALENPEAAALMNRIDEAQLEYFARRNMR